MKKCILLFTAILVLAVFISCTKQDNNNIAGGDKAGEKLFDSDTQISIVVGSHPSWPYNEDWAFWRYFREAVGGDIKLQVIAGMEFDTKVTLMMTSPEELPDLIHVTYKNLADQFSPSGALIAIEDYIDLMPNYKKFWDSIPEEERNELLTRRKSGDGKTYYPQIYGMERATNVRAWLYRKDIFEKHGLSTPETMDEVYDVAKKLKELYPDSYPLCMRNGLLNLNVMGPQWKPYFSTGAYYDFASEKWSYGAAEPTMLEIVRYFKKMCEEGLVPPDFLTIPIKSWEELVSTDRGFMMPEYQVRMDYFNLPVRTTKPEFTLSAMVPPKGNAETGQHKVAKYNVDPTGYLICNTGDKIRIENSIKLIDWMYSDEAAELLSWGKEGETYEVKDGKRRFILGEGEDAKQKFGALSYGLYLRVLPEAGEAAVSDEQAATTSFVLEHTELKYNPANWLALDEEEIRVRDDIGSSLDTFRDQMISKFILGQEPLSKWDSFIAELKSMGIDDLLAVYESAYNRVIK